MKTRTLTPLLCLCWGIFTGVADAGDQSIPALPEPVSNNAVATISQDGVQYIMSFMGLGSGRTHHDIVNSAWLWTSESGEWEAFPDVPVEQGRLASVAVGMYDRILLFGGYTVAEDGSEISTPEVFIVDPAKKTYKRRSDIPLPVDDTVALPYANRYIYLVSGWHNEGNVSNVQLYDTWEDKWAVATEFPGTPVFGHAGGLVGNTLIIVGGVGVLGVEDGKRQFGAIDQAWKGIIDAENPEKIDWQPLPPTKGTDRYRMASVGDEESNLVILAGGTDRPYNFSGIGYDGQPAEPTGAVFAWDTAENDWIHFENLDRAATMDHRGLIPLDVGVFVTIGGMVESQQVSAQVTPLQLPDR